MTKARIILPRLVAGFALAVVLAALVIAVLLWPVLLVFLIAGVLVGLLIRFLLSRRRGHKSDRIRPKRPRSDRRRRARWTWIGAGAAVVVVLALAGLRILDSDAPPIRLPLEATKYRVPYQANLKFQSEGDWSGQERFTLKRADAKAVVDPGAGTLFFRLRAAIPSEWDVRSETTDKGITYVIQRDYPSHPFSVPSSAAANSRYLAASALVVLTGLELRPVGSRRIYDHPPCPGASHSGHYAIERCIA